MSDFIDISEHRGIFPPNTLRSSSKEYFEWKILKNPFKQGKVYLERDMGKVTGSLTITPKKLSVEGNEILGAELGDAFTHPEHRKQGIFVRGIDACNDFALSQGIELIYAAGPNSQSLPIFLKKTSYILCTYVKMNFIAKPCWNLLSVMKSFAKQILPGKHDLYLPALFKQNISIHASHYLKDSISNEPFNIFKIDKFTDEIDGFWGSHRYSFFTIRDKTYLNWRYFQNPDEYNVIVAQKGNKYLGYIVTKLSSDRRIGAICDFITVDDRQDVFYLLIKAAERELDKAGVQWIQLWCIESSPYYQVLHDLGYWPQGSDYRQPMVVYFNSDSCKTILEKKAKWHFVLSDSDNV